MSYEFTEFVNYCGIEMPFKFIELNPLYSVNFAGNNKNYLIYKDLAKLANEFKDIEPNFEAENGTLSGKGRHSVSRYRGQRLSEGILGRYRTFWPPSPPFPLSMPP